MLAQYALPPLPHAVGVDAAHWQTPLTHVWPSVQPAPQEEVPTGPQFFGSVRVSVQMPLQSVSPERQEAAHAPLVHTVPAAQVVPQPPQLRLSVLKSVQKAAGPEAGHWLDAFDVLSHEHLEPMHEVPGAQIVPQEPQFTASPVVSVQVPKQLDSPLMQLIEQVPLPLQSCPAGQTLPHLPQLLLSTFVLAQ